MATMGTMRTAGWRWTAESEEREESGGGGECSAEVTVAQKDDWRYTRVRIRCFRVLRVGSLCNCVLTPQPFVRSDRSFS